MLVLFEIVKCVIGIKDVFIFVNKLILLSGIFEDSNVESVIYYYFLFDCYEVIFVEGVFIESFYMGFQFLNVLFLVICCEIEVLFFEIVVGVLDFVCLILSVKL